MGLAISLMIHNYYEYKQEEKTFKNFSYIELPGELICKLDKKDKQILFNNSIYG